MTQRFDERLLDVLVCPLSRTRLRYDEAAQELVSDEAGIAYPIRNGVAVMLIEEARRIVLPMHRMGRETSRRLVEG